MPLFSAIVWTMMVGISIIHSNTRKEKDVKWTVLWMYVAFMGSWLFLIPYTYWPRFSIYFSVTGYAGLLIVPLQLYHIICKLSETDKLKPFSCWHYILPAIIVGILFIWSFFVPFDTQVWLLENRGAIAPGYEAYSRLFLSKPAMRIVFTVVYMPLGLVRLYRYYRGINHGAESLRRPARWATILIVCVSLMLVGTLISVIYPRGEFVMRWITVITIPMIVVEHITVGYQVISRNFLLYVKDDDENEAAPVQTADKKRRPKPAAANTGKPAGIKLTRRNFDAWMKQHKPWLNAGFRITDLVEPLGANRTKISNFVNATYGMNFNRYINNLRLDEVDRLAALQSNAGKPKGELALSAGFANDRGYRRAAEAEREAQNKIDAVDATRESIAESGAEDTHKDQREKGGSYDR